MRHVALDRVESVIPAEWHAKAKKVNEELAAATTVAGRKAIVKANEDLWREAGRHLATVMEGKCWYCEIRDVRSDHPVDHYRPKGRVAGESHGGYWWLTFALENYRWSCTFCNSRRVDVEGGTSGGKQDFFPLSPSGKRAQVPADSLENEHPLLLDPTDSRDVALLLFDETGVPSLDPKHAQIHDDLRVEASIEFYHWRHRPLASARRLIFRKVAVVCADADNLLQGFERTRDQAIHHKWMRSVRALNMMADRASEHSAAALCALRGLRTASRSAAEALDLP
ncbi:hypothetical protein Drose_35985 [Dactylosporangium roseum]|uniref:HNH domain-containing protein n=1 Tax=Dactylosporangium roseum TaxID=47989 RepID=A0ABY5Z3I5_9ACTN|nr:hypothetical protein [Dactylosporangium roseum]UWZ36377.1 hypothetical protein Drose_35985 [Dactylosporangium roseum]